MIKPGVRYKVPLNVRVSEALHTRISIYARDNGLDISSAVRSLLFKMTRDIKLKKNATNKRLHAG